MKLRQRRTGGQMILPLHQTTSGSASTRTRRRKRGNGGVRNVATYCSFIACTLLGVFVCVGLRRSFQYPTTQKNYTPLVCADGTTGFKDDDYCDCSDGIDEPNTAACSDLLVQKKTFRCHDGSMMIHASRVRDGVFDCHDRSDETEKIVRRYSLNSYTKAAV